MNTSTMTYSCGRLFLATLFLIFAGKADGLSGHGKSIGAAWCPATGNWLLPLRSLWSFGCIRGCSRCGSRSSALLMFFYTFGTALIAHRYGHKGRGAGRRWIAFTKILSNMGGFLLLYRGSRSAPRACRRADHPRHRCASELQREAIKLRSGDKRYPVHELRRAMWARSAGVARLFGKSCRGVPTP